MLFQEELNEHLVNLGLTPLQAKVYCTLLNLEKLSAKDVAMLSNVPRQEVYRVLAELLFLGLVEKIIVMPTKYRAVPLQDALSTLLEQKTKKIAGLQAKTKMLIKKALGNKKSQTEKESSYEFVEIPEKRASKNQSIERMVTEKLDLIVGLNKFAPWMCSIEPKLNALLRKGVRMRFITDKSLVDTPILRLVNNLANYPTFEMRYMANGNSQSSQFSQVAIVDKKLAALSTDHITSRTTPVLQSNHPSFINLAQQYFETMWLHAEKAEAHKAATLV